jgi:hypothetical protein
MAERSGHWLGGWPGRVAPLRRNARTSLANFPSASTRQQRSIPFRSGKYRVARRKKAQFPAVDAAANKKKFRPVDAGGGGGEGGALLAFVPGRRMEV